MQVSGRRQLFAASFAAIVAISFCFVPRTLVIGDWQRVRAQ